MTSQSAPSLHTQPARPFDHFVAVVKDIYLAERAYQRLGFRTTPVVPHLQLGTSNSVIQLSNAYIELLGDIEHYTERSESDYIVKNMLQERIDNREGLMLASFRSDDLDLDRDAFERSGLITGPRQDSERDIRLPNGGWRRTASSAVGLIDVDRPGHACIVSCHNKPEYIWISQWMVHPNTAKKVTGLVYVAPAPDDLVDFFTPIVGVAPDVRTSEEVSFTVGDSATLTILSPGALAKLYGAEDGLWNAKVGTYPVGIEVIVEDLGACRWVLRDGGVSFYDTGSALTTRPAFGLGVSFTFYST